MQTVCYEIDKPVVVLEKLNLSGMTKSEKGTAENPGKNVRAKAGMNWVLLEGAPR